MCKKVLSIYLWIIGPVVVLGSVLNDAQPTQASAGWSHWAGWSPCTKTCGFGQRFRARSCTDPAPKKDNTKTCSGQTKELRYCYKGPCIGQETKGLVFSGKSYQNYTVHDIPKRYLVLYIHFRPLLSDATLIHRYRDCDINDKCSHEVLVNIEKNHIRLLVMDGGFSTSLQTQNAIKIGEWQTLLVQITRRLVILRLDDKKRITTSLATLDTIELNFDATMVIGSKKDGTDGFIGSILKLRVNFKDLSLFNIPDWVGFGAPVKQHGISIEKTDSAESHTRFLGKYSAQIHFKHKTVLLIKLTIYFMDTEGVILFNQGRTPGAFVSLSLHNAALRFCFSLGRRAVCQKAVLLQVRRWYYLSVLVHEKRGELRVDKGRAVQLNTEGKRYKPKQTLYVGGGERQDWEVITKLTHEDTGFDGVISEVFVNGKLLPFKNAVLVDRDGRVNSDGYSVSAHVSEVYEVPSSKVTMRCDAGLFAKQGGLVKVDWIESDKYIVTGDGEEIIPKVPGNPHESALMLKPNSHHEGIYACVINHDGFRIITHTFPVLRHAVSITQMGIWSTMTMRALLVVGPLLLLTCCILCCTICCKCCKGKKKTSAISMTPVVPPRVTDGDTVKLLDKIESGPSEHIYTDLDYYNTGMKEDDGLNQAYEGNDDDTYESPIDGEMSARTEQTGDSESDSRDEEQEEKDEILEKASRVLELIGSIDNLKKVCSRLSQERIRSSEVDINQSQREFAEIDEEDETGDASNSPTNNFADVPPPRLSQYSFEN